MQERTAEVEVAPGLIWFVLLGGAIAWAVHLLAAYALGEFGCVAGWGHIYFRGLHLVAWLVLAVTLITAVVTAAALWASVRMERRLEQAGAGEEAALEPDRPAPFAARFGVITNGLFLFIILFEAVPVLYFLRHC